ncbi:MAG: hypothetical protein QOK01_3532 [Alphaproteobacteria bacterium]|nr:hypothetical protein [Alphaproteobacteria bacterium]
MRDDSEKSAAVIRAQIGEAPLDVGLVVGASLAATEARARIRRLNGKVLAILLTRRS